MEDHGGPWTLLRRDLVRHRFVRLLFIISVLAATLLLALVLARHVRFTFGLLLLFFSASGWYFAYWLPWGAALARRSSVDPLWLTVIRVIEAAALVGLVVTQGMFVATVAVFLLRALN